MTTPAWISPRKQGPPRGGRSATEATPSQDQAAAFSDTIVVHVSCFVVCIVIVEERRRVKIFWHKKKQQNLSFYTSEVKG
jgi:hypothetical protein